MNIAWRTLVPNLFTATSAVFGLTSIWLSVEGNYRLAAWFIFWCVLLDKMDGTAARLLKGSSKFGMEFDSMADLISFGLAPSVLVFAAGHKLWGMGEELWSKIFLLVACAFFSLMAAVRLARFNVADNAPDDRNFAGIPTTFCGIIVPAAFLLATKYELSVDWMRFFPALILVLGLAMVSSMPVPKIKPRKSKAFNIFQAVNAVAIYVCGFLMVGEEYFLLLAASFVIIGTPLELIRGWRKRQQTGAEAAG